MDKKETIKKYLELIRQFTAGEIAASEFSLEYIETFKAEEKLPDDALFEPLNSLFAEADAYCEDPELRGKRDINEEELMEAARVTEKTLVDQLERTHS